MFIAGVVDTSGKWLTSVNFFDPKFGSQQSPGHLEKPLEIANYVLFRASYADFLSSPRQMRQREKETESGQE